MICVLNESNQIINIVNTDVISADNERPYYPWNRLWEQYTDVIPVEYAKDSKIAEAKAIRDTSEVAPIEYNGNTYNFDSKSRDRLDIALMALTASGGTIAWTMADNTQVSVCADDINNVFLAAAKRSNELHEKYRTLKTLVEACTDMESVSKVVWS